MVRQGVNENTFGINIEKNGLDDWLNILYQGVQLSRSQGKKNPVDGQGLDGGRFKPFRCTETMLDICFQDAALLTSCSGHLPKDTISEQNYNAPYFTSNLTQH